MRRLFLLPAALLLFSAAAAHAAGPAPDVNNGPDARNSTKAGSAPKPEDKFRNMDKDGDGNLTREEFFAAYPFMHEAAFKGIDKNGDEGISLEEWLTFSSSHNRDMNAGGMMMGSPGPGGGPAMRRTPGEERPEAPSPSDRGGERARRLFELKPQDETGN